MISLDERVKYPITIEVPEDYWTFSTFFDFEIDYLEEKEEEWYLYKSNQKVDIYHKFQGE